MAGAAFERRRELAAKYLPQAPPDDLTRLHLARLEGRAVGMIRLHLARLEGRAVGMIQAHRRGDYRARPAPSVRTPTRPGSTT